MAKNPKPSSSSSTSPQNKKTKTSSSLLPTSKNKDAPPPSNPRLTFYLEFDIMHHIFSFLPIRDHIELSILAKEFTKSWTHNRKLLFRDGRLPPWMANEEKLVAMIDRIFNSHNGSNIDSFQLHFDPIGHEALLEKWLRICIRKQIQELELGLPTHPDFVLASEFFDIPTLKVLIIESCALHVPPVMMNGLRNLHTLVFRYVALRDGQLETIIRNANMLINLDLWFIQLITSLGLFLRRHKHLKALKIVNCYSLENIEIDCPTLESFHFRGPATTKMEFHQDVPLVEANFLFSPINSREYVPPFRMENLANQALHARILTTAAQFQEGLANKFRGGVQESQLCFSNVKELHMVMAGGMFCNVYDIIMFVKSCPSLEELFIDLNEYTLQCGVYWEMHQKLKLESFIHFFDKLRVIKLSGITFSTAEICLLEILLKRSRFLHTLVLVSPRWARKKVIKPTLQKLEQFLNAWKAPRTSVIAFDYQNDESGIYPTHSPYYWY